MAVQGPAFGDEHVAVLEMHAVRRGMEIAGDNGARGGRRRVAVTRTRTRTGRVAAAAATAAATTVAAAAAGLAVFLARLVFFLLVLLVFECIFEFMARVGPAESPDDSVVEFMARVCAGCTTGKGTQETAVLRRRVGSGMVA